MKFMTTTVMLPRMLTIQNKKVQRRNKGPVGNGGTGRAMEKRQEKIGVGMLRVDFGNLGKAYQDLETFVMYSKPGVFVAVDEVVVSKGDGGCVAK